MNSSCYPQKKFYTIGTIFVYLIVITIITAFTGKGFQIFNSFTLLIYAAVAMFILKKELFGSRCLQFSCLAVDILLAFVGAASGVSVNHDSDTPSIIS